MTRRSELITALESAPRDLTRLLKGIDPATQGNHPGKWSLSDVVNHLLLVEERYLVRLQRVTLEDNPILPYIRPAPELHNLTIPLENLSVQFSQARTQTLAFLHPLSSGVWARLGTRRPRPTR